MHFYHRFIIALTIIALGLTGCMDTPTTKPAAEAPDTIIKSSRDNRTYERVQLTNGLQVILVSAPDSETAAVDLILPIGSTQDPPSQQGLAHYLEHMLIFGGSAHYPDASDFSRFTQNNGGFSNATTDLDTTDYYFSISATHLDEALDRFSDIFTQPRLDPAFAEKELESVHNEWSQDKTHLDHIIAAVAGITANPQNPRTKFTLGNKDTLKDKPDSLLQQELIHFYEHNYSANLMTVTLVSKQSLPELQALATHYFSRIPNRHIDKPTASAPGLTPPYQHQLITVRTPQQSHQLIIEFPIANNSNDWRNKPNNYLQALINSQAPGSLNEQLHRTGYAEQVALEIQPDFYGNDGYARILLQLTEQGYRAQDKVIAAVFAYTELIRQSPIEQARYDELQTIADKSFHYTLRQEPVLQARSLSAAQLKYPTENLLNGAFYYAPFAETPIRHLLDQLEPTQARIWLIAPDVAAEPPVPHFDAQYSQRRISASEWSRWHTAPDEFHFALPPLNELLHLQGVPIATPVYRQPTLIDRLPGMDIYLTHSRYCYKNGNAQYVLEINPETRPDALQSLTYEEYLFTYYQIQTRYLRQKAMDAGLELSFGKTDSGGITIRVAGYAEKLPDLLQETVVLLANATPDQPAHQEIIQGINDALDNIYRSDLHQSASLDLELLLSGVDIQQFKQSLNKLNAIHMGQYHHQLFQQGLTRFLIIGNCTNQQASNMAAKLKPYLHGSRQPELRLATTQLPDAGQQMMYHADSDLADNAIMQLWPAPEPTPANRAALKLLNTIFHPDFFSELRTHQQLGYNLSSSVLDINGLPALRLYVQSASTDLPTLTTRVDEFRTHYAQRLESMSDQEFANIRDSQVAQYPLIPTSFSDEVNITMEGFERGVNSFYERQEYLTALKRLKKSDIIQLYNTMMLGKDARPITIQLRGKNFQQTAMTH